MYIKYKGLKTDNVTIINVNISQSVDIVVEDDILIINMPNKEDTLKLKLSSNETAKLAQEKLFMTLGLKSPLSGILDLTNVDVIDVDKRVGITLQDIADKFNVDLRELSIVAIPSNQKIEISKVLEEDVEEEVDE